MSATSFESPEKLEEAAHLFRSRGFREVDHPLLPLWPGEFRTSQDATLTYGIEWTPQDADPAGPLRALLRELHAMGRGDLVGMAVCGLEAGTAPKKVYREVSGCLHVFPRSAKAVAGG